jgi:hypothetical protein
MHTSYSHAFRFLGECARIFALKIKDIFNSPVGEHLQGIQVLWHGSPQIQYSSMPSSMLIATPLIPSDFVWDYAAVSDRRIWAQQASSTRLC